MMCVQFLQEPAGTHPGVIYAAVMDKCMFGPFLAPGQTDSKPIEVVYAMGQVSYGVFEAIWALWDAVLFKQMVGQDESELYLAHLKNNAKLDRGDWAVLDPNTPTVPPASPDRERSPPNTTRSTMNPPHRNESDVRQVTRTVDKQQSGQHQRPLRSVVVEQEGIPVSYWCPQSEQMTPDGLSLLTAFRHG
jgi:hypothetical protein